LFPLRDENPTLLTPWITLALIAANVVVWIYIQGAGVSETALAESVCRYGTIPAEVTGQTGGYEGIELTPGGPPCTFGGLTIETLLTGIFLHGSWVHLIANMWFLWLFGNNIEDSMGHFRYLLFYVLMGLAATAAHILAGPNSVVPTVGASGAISGIMGAYLVLYPRVRILTLFIIIIFIRIIPIPAWVVLLFWFALQVLSGYSTPMDRGGGGVAFWAHVGGFVAGVLLVKLFENRTLVDARKRHVRLRPEELAYRGWL
jgi:membrane associated rhomboid family serine protease